ncbi:MAG: hypothetical protein HOV80_21805 [Polyangiaceae bacterium]|nr:hypothetical protein [Polyangiaceae bacterium]
MDRDRVLSTSFEGLKDSMGDAKDLPAQIVALLSDDPTERRDAIDAVQGRLFHQGTVAPAAERAVPILIDIALDRETVDRHLTLVFLRTLLTCLPENQRDALGSGPSAKPTEIATRTAALITARAGDFLSLLEADDARARGAAATLAAFAAMEPPQASLATDRIAAARAVEAHPLAQASEAAAHSLAARRASRPARDAFVATLASGERLVRIAAAVGVLGSIDGERSFVDAADVLRDAEPGELLLEYHDFPWASGDPGLLAAEALSFAARKCRSDKPVPEWTPFEVAAVRAMKRIIAARLPFRDAEARRITPGQVMLARMQGLPEPAVYEPPADELQKAYSLTQLGTYLLEIAFSDLQGREQPATREDLRPEQLELVRFLAVECALAAHYGRFGLPPSYEDLAAFF